jgi:uncharacterized membrane protein YkoI
MKFALPCFLLLSVTLSMSTFAHGSFTANNYVIKANQQSHKQQLRVTSSQQAAQMAKSRFGGKVLKVKKQKSSYRIKLIKNNGHIISVSVDAKTGNVSGGN